MLVQKTDASNCSLLKKKCISLLHFIFIQSRHFAKVIVIEKVTKKNSVCAAVSAFIVRYCTLNSFFFLFQNVSLRGLSLISYTSRCVWLGIRLSISRCCFNTYRVFHSRCEIRTVWTLCNRWWINFVFVYFDIVPLYGLIQLTNACHNKKLFFFFQRWHPKKTVGTIRRCWEYLNLLIYFKMKSLLLYAKSNVLKRQAKVLWAADLDIYQQYEERLFVLIKTCK